MTQAPRASARYEELEAYRGVAALLVVLFHAYQFTREGTAAQTYLYEGTPLHTLFVNLDTPVAWFFTLSGFLIFLPIATSLLSSGSALHPGAFLLRRAIRIVPLYYVVILVVWTLRYTGSPENWTDLFEHLTFTHVFDSHFIFYTVGPAWSLGVEVMFYLLLALLGPWLHARATNRAAPARVRLLLAWCSGLIALSLLAKFAVHAFMPTVPRAFTFGPIAHLDSFALGMLLAVIVVTRREQAPLGATARLAVRLVALALVAFTFGLRFQVDLVRTFAYSLSGLAFALWLASTVLAPSASRMARRLAHPVWAHVGLISYGVYLWHEPIMLELAKRGLLVDPAPSAFWRNALVLAILAILVANVTYWLIEYPATFLRRAFDSRGRFIDPYEQARRK
ncbi:acyltransferase family protein [Deinococcus yavapaiensis]|uniref:Peptidoglycan/LPS O-acetylase OafA/YrhL n=1 Tax=Deinococcus yavapaiensis KR-236 TaxID=694435 RepID=A0A318SAM1_9DEIO|nr:acyltransferase [Deinococcus yavapaiensis]PYE55260.1 peptidoglycan/LPS O-acetylase OafA/YrhL [Deinococcus yavapaiensis KR-236]